MLLHHYLIQIAGIILDSWARGRKKHVWFSISNDLKLDAQRDLKDVGCHISVVDGCQVCGAAFILLSRRFLVVVWWTVPL